MSSSESDIEECDATGSLIVAISLAYSFVSLRMTIITIVIFATQLLIFNS